jgi:Xaa-Pro aminopeptidase
MWSSKQMKEHIYASRKLIKIKDSVFNLIKTKKDISEYEIQQFILSSYKKEGLKTDSYLPLVAFNENIATPYLKYKASKLRKTRKDTLILIDIWARKNTSKAPFADISWVAYKGKVVPKKVIHEFKSTMKTRDAVIKFIKQKLKKNIVPSGKEVDIKAKECLIKEGYKGKVFFTGHCLGFSTTHENYGNLSKENKNPLIMNLGYALEPGMYTPGKYYIRNEIDFYISDKNKLIVTTDIQKKIVLI